MKKSYIKDIIYGSIIIILVYLGVLFIWNNLSDLIVRFPILNYLYNLALSEIEQKSVYGLSILTFIGSLFFVLYPSEVIFLLYIKTGYNIFYISAVMLFWMMLAQLFNYGFGYFLKETVLEKFVASKKGDYLTSLKKYDILFIIVLNILPVPADILIVLLGMIKYNFKKGMLYTLIGKTLKLIFMGLLIYSLNTIWF